MRKILCRQSALALAFCVYGGISAGQTLMPRPAQSQANGSPLNSQSTAAEEGKAAGLMIVPMSVAAGTPIKVALDSEVRIGKVGQAIHGKTTDPVYAFDKLLIPVGTPVNGRIAAIDAVPKKLRTLEAAAGDFSPRRNVQVQFEELVMGDGRHMALQTLASPAPDGVLRFVSANEKSARKNKAEEAAGKKASETKQEIRRQWSELQKQIHEPGKMHKVKRMALAQLPVHPQYMNEGASFNAVLQQPLDFGTEAVKTETLTRVGAAPPTGSVVHARLVTPLSSATAKKGDAVEALITEPLTVNNHLILPEGSVIKGAVMQAQPARRLGRNGQLRILFHEVAPPNGLQQRVETSLEGVAVAKGEHLKLDSEGGARITTPRTRYFTSGLAVALAANADDDVINSAGNGASGFRFAGALAGLLARSRVASRGLGAYGATMSIYAHFLARGRDVVYPKDMAMVVGLGTREGKTGGF